MKKSSFRRPPGARRTVSTAAAMGLAAVLAVVCVACGQTKSGNTAEGGSGNPAPTGAVAVGSDVTASVNKLVVAEELSMSGYSREKFPHWDTNPQSHGFDAKFAQYSKCTTRDVMMLRDSTGSVTLDPKTCDLKVGKGGGWQDQYGVLDAKTGKLKPYKFITDPAGVDAEHIVPLAEAWRSGASKFDEATRQNIANDAINLIASDPSANRSKGDQDAAHYLPPGAFRCGYLDHYVQIKIKYNLTVDNDELKALRTAVDDCVKQGGFR
ncbi:HNH endonuclease family protein [Nocardia jejuensis]|uniref:HNH endonuclease family protein n=1 Tax=Nocardia jejuensis TaxID=328049 RepID=UPI0008349E5E|nr:HNH endonuclease family protein [Nocardia jejuensis]